MTIKPLRSTTKILNSREREIYRNAIMDGDNLLIELSSPYARTLKLITETTLKALEDAQVPVRMEDK